MQRTVPDDKGVLMRIALLADIYSNDVALDAAVKDIDAQMFT